LFLRLTGIPKDANGGLAAGDKYLNAGTLYVAKFNDDGTGQWLPLTLANSRIANYADYKFADQAEVLVNARIAADAAGATKMDRPEWGAVNPLNGDVYVTLTNNSRRGDSAALNAANPRFYTDEKGSKSNQGNVNGHIIRWREAGGNPAANTFSWDIYLFGSQADALPEVKPSRLTGENDFSSPDGLWFSQAVPGLLWIQTDDGAYTDVSNCMMLAALPGRVGDGVLRPSPARRCPATIRKIRQSVPTWVNPLAQLPYGAFWWVPGIVKSPVSPSLPMVRCFL
jgi:secreted PhoX family phosphatase